MSQLCLAPPNTSGPIVKVKCLCSECKAKEPERVSLWAEDGDIQEACERLSKGGPNFGPSGVTAETLLDAVVFSLNWDYGACIESIHNDQWSGISAKTYDGKLTTWVQCDSVLNGVAATWKAIAERVEAQER